MRAWDDPALPVRLLSGMGPSSVVEGPIPLRTHYRFTVATWHHRLFVEAALHGAPDGNGVVVDDDGVGLPVAGDIGEGGAACAVVGTVRPVLVWPEMLVQFGASR